ncbi:hypothetical protein BBAD15_g1465 [Beauveria bassiana D1-5]|uniref:Uncharacterized protein n=1 Tax=Beauveria bassiana D1-5 TaxID=1245745 RepID=A0A0A2W2W6_BEABA|nr:hypothetical protein BBAD15_g1465 [Beauveria bassiana D1-5]
MAHTSWWSTRHPPRRPTPPISTCTSNHPPRPSFTLLTLVDTAPSVSSLLLHAKYADCKLDASVTVTTAAVSSSSSTASESDDSEANNNNNASATTMSKGRGERRSSITKTSRPDPSPVSRTGTNRDKHHASQRSKRTARDVHSPDAVSPSVAALLAMTDIPRHRQPVRQKRKFEKSLTVQDIVQNQHVSEKELSFSLTGSPLDLLLSPPDELPTEDDMSTCESPDGFPLRHTVSCDSVPSLGDSYATDPASSFDSSPYFARPRRTRSPARKYLEPVRSPPHILSDEHPLSLGLDEDEYHPIVSVPVEEPPMSVFSEPFKPLKAAFKSNLTASLRALRSAAKSFSSINFPALPPDDLLSRSILTIDPNVPYTDERRPPVTEEMPSAELRRYLNPTTRPLEAQPQDGPQRPRLTSIQMQTYKVHRARVAPSWNLPSSSALPPAASATGTGILGGGAGGGSSSPAPKSGHHQPQHPKGLLPAAMRQREIRENPDFIRIAVMEMAMRKRGKLDDRKPGRARWALPPRKAPIRSADAQDNGPNGVPTRWIPITYEQ